MKRLVAAVFVWGCVVACGSCEQPPCDGWDKNGDGQVVLAVLGDSNTFSMSGGTWPYLLDLPSNWTMRSFAVPGGFVAVWPGRVLDEKYAGAQMTAALAWRSDIDLVIMAFGTNDYRLGATIEQVLDGYETQALRAVAAGARPKFALTPPCWWESVCDDGVRALIESGNAAQLEKWPFTGQIDFWTGFDQVWFKDALHFTPAGQAERAGRVIAALF